ncbi:MAG: sensor signal transduction histidine kinase [Chthoniobacter sp.]|nr:sensor signal transduction histidine kinase [Chthoniobacter sp.]
MEWLPGFIVAAAIALAWWAAHRRAARNWQRALDDIAAGTTPEHLPHKKLLAPSLQRIAELVADRQNWREQITREQSNLRMILGSMEEGVMVVDAHHVVRQVNPSFLKLFDLKSDPCGQTVLRTLRAPEFEEIITSALATGEAKTSEVARGGTKSVQHFAVHAVPMHDDPQRQGVVTIFRDITRLKRLEEVRREFVANVSHELRTPLSIFHGYLENLLDDPAMPRKAQAEVFEILRKHSLRLNALLEDLLTLARLESRPETLQIEPLNVEELVRGFVADWKLSAARKKIEVEVEIESGLPKLPADAHRIEQVLNNLLENAVKYTEQGGRICIRAQRADECFELRIEDTGIGIPPTDLVHIFERFYRADKARTRELGGTGLGLSIVKHIAQLHGGSVVAESTYGKGTAIIVRLPWEPVSTREAEEAPAPSSRQ